MFGNFDPWALAKSMQTIETNVKAKWDRSDGKWKKSKSSASGSAGPKEPEEWPAAPEVKRLMIPAGIPSEILSAGYPNECYAIEHWNCEVFSCAHHVLQELCGENIVDDVVTIEHDSDDKRFPEVQAAWKMAGNAYNTVTVAKCLFIKHWAVGLGGKKNGGRAAKLAMAVTIAAVYMASETTAPKVTQAVLQYPEFGKLLIDAGILGLKKEELDLIVKQHQLQQVVQEASSSDSSARAAPY